MVPSIHPRPTARTKVQNLCGLGDINALRVVPSMEVSPWVCFGLRERGAEGVSFGWLWFASGGD